MTNTKNERQEAEQRYKELDAGNRVIFKSILDLIVVLLKSTQK